MFKILSTIIFVSLFIGCNSTKPVSSYKQLNFNAFSIQVPSNWEKLTLRGIDSYVGGIKMDLRDTVHFDLGMYSNTLSDQSNSITIWETINGYDARIVTPKSGVKGITAVYIDSVSGEGLNRKRFNIYGHDISLKNRNEFLRSIRTLKFKS